jgi:RNA polymerase sigma-70 factor (ECF subfamily)
MDVRDTRADERNADDDECVLRDEEIVRKVCAGESERFDQLLQRYNRRLFRIARAVLHSDQEAEDVVQETWLRAFRHMRELAEPERFAAWVSRIALYEAWARSRRSRRLLPGEPNARSGRLETRSASVDPERAASEHEIQRIVEAAIDALPEKYRVVLVLRGIEGLSTAEVARSLRLSRVAVSTRFHRARTLLRQELFARFGLSPDSFPFLGPRCEGMRRRVMALLPATWAALGDGG